MDAAGGREQQSHILSLPLPLLTNPAMCLRYQERRAKSAERPLSLGSGRSFHPFGYGGERWHIVFSRMSNRVVPNFCEDTSSLLGGYNLCQYSSLRTPEIWCHTLNHLLSLSLYICIHDIYVYIYISLSPSLSRFIQS